jgi:hypothetical protein
LFSFHGKNTKPNNINLQKSVIQTLLLSRDKRYKHVEEDMELRKENMKRKIDFHPKLFSILVILLLFGIAIAPGFNAVKITRSIDNISNNNSEEESENYEILIDDCNCQNNSKDTGYPRICDFLSNLYLCYMIIMVLPFILAWAYYEGGYISETMLQIIWGAIFLPMYPVVKLNELLNCPELELPDGWTDP